MKTVLYALLLSSLTACSVRQVQDVRQQPGVNFASYRTYNFRTFDTRNETELPSQLLGLPELRQAVAEELQRRGYRQADAPDVWVDIDVLTRDQVQTRQTDLYDAPPYMGQRRYAWYSQEVPVNQYREGVTTVALTDAKQDAVVWQGTVSNVLTTDYERRTRRIGKAVAKLFEAFPVEAR